MEFENKNMNDAFKDIHISNKTLEEIEELCQQSISKLKNLQKDYQIKSNELESTNTILLKVIDNFQYCEELDTTKEAIERISTACKNKSSELKDFVKQISSSFCEDENDIEFEFNLNNAIINLNNLEDKMDRIG